MNQHLINYLAHYVVPHIFEMSSIVCLKPQVKENIIVYGKPVVIGRVTRMAKCIIVCTDAELDEAYDKYDQLMAESLHSQHEAEVIINQAINSQFDPE
jgi:hypothetical protein